MHRRKHDTFALTARVAGFHSFRNPPAINIDTKDELVQATGHPPERAQVLLWNKLHALSIRGLGATTEPTLKGTADYRRCVDSNPPWAVEEALQLAEVLRGND